jgi:hypothetical protein
MTATQSHALRFTDVPALRMAWPEYEARRRLLGGYVPALFTAVIAGIVEVALTTARAQVARRPALRPYEQVEWSRVELEGWLVRQAYAGMLAAVEAGRDGEALVAKTAIAELAESALGRLGRVLGGGAYARTAPFGFWAEDVRALGYLRPPWGLAYDQLDAYFRPPPA